MENREQTDYSKARECVSVIANYLEQLEKDAENRNAEGTESPLQREESPQLQIAGQNESNVPERVCSENDEDYLRCVNEGRGPIASSTPIQSEEVLPLAEKPAYKISYYTTIKQDENGRFSKIYTIRKFTPDESKDQERARSLSRQNYESSALGDTTENRGASLRGIMLQGPAEFRSMRRIPSSEDISLHTSRPIADRSPSIPERSQTLRRVVTVDGSQQINQARLVRQGAFESPSEKYRTLRRGVTDEGSQQINQARLFRQGAFESPSDKYRTLRRGVTDDGSQQIDQARLVRQEAFESPSDKYRTLRRGVTDDGSQQIDQARLVRQRAFESPSDKYRTLRRGVTDDGSQQINQARLVRQGTFESPSEKYRSLRRVKSVEQANLENDLDISPVKRVRFVTPPERFQRIPFGEVDSDLELSPPLLSSTPIPKPYAGRQLSFATRPGRLQTLKIAVTGDQNQQMGQVEERELETDPDSASYRFSERVKFLPNSDPFEHMQQLAENFETDGNMSLRGLPRTETNEQDLRRQLSWPAISSPSQIDFQPPQNPTIAPSITSEQQAAETLNELIDVNLKGFEKIIKSLQVKTPYECRKDDLPSDPKLLIDVLVKSLQQTEDNLIDLRKDMQFVLSQMAQVIANKAKEKLPQFVELADEVNNTKCQLEPGPSVPSSSGALDSGSKSTVNENQGEEEDKVKETKTSIEKVEDSKGSGSSIIFGISSKKKFFRTRSRDKE